MKELESFRGHRKDVTALAWHPFHEEYFVSGSFDGSIFHWLVGHETPQVELPGAHENSVWDLAWHPTGYLLCSGGNDHATRFWCRNRPGDQARDKFNVIHAQGYGDHNPLFTGRAMSGYPMLEAPPTPGAFAAGLSRNEGTIPGIGVAMPLAQSLDGSDQEQRPQIPGIPPGGAPPLPPGPHPSLLAAGQQQAYQQVAQQVPQQQQQQHPQFPQQMVSLPLAPPNMNQLQPPAHLPHLTHAHLARPPPPQIPSLGMTNAVPSSMPGSMPMPMHNPMVMQGSANQMITPLLQSHMMGINQMQPGAMPNNNLQQNMGGFAGGMANIQGAPNSGMLNFPMGGLFNRQQGGQIGPIQGLNAFQPGMMDVRAPGMGLGGNMGLPPPPPLPQSSAPQ